MARMVKTISLPPYLYDKAKEIKNFSAWVQDRLEEEGSIVHNQAHRPIPELGICNGVRRPNNNTIRRVRRSIESASRSKIEAFISKTPQKRIYYLQRIVNMSSTGGLNTTDYSPRLLKKFRKPKSDIENLRFDVCCCSS